MLQVRLGGCLLVLPRTHTVVKIPAEQSATAAVALLAEPTGQGPLLAVSVLEADHIDKFGNLLR